MVEKFRLINWISLGLITGAIIFALLSLIGLLAYQENLRFNLPALMRVVLTLD